VLVQTMCYEEGIMGDHMNHISYPHHKKICSYVGKILSDTHCERCSFFALCSQSHWLQRITDQFKDLQINVRAYNWS